MVQLINNNEIHEHTGGIGWGSGHWESRGSYRKDELTTALFWCQGHGVLPVQMRLLSWRCSEGTGTCISAWRSCSVYKRITLDASLSFRKVACLSGSVLHGISKDRQMASGGMCLLSGKKPTYKRMAYHTSLLAVNANFCSCCLGMVGTWVCLPEEFLENSWAAQFAGVQTTMYLLPFEASSLYV